VFNIRKIIGSLLISVFVMISFLTIYFTKTETKICDEETYENLENELGKYAVSPGKNSLGLANAYVNDSSNTLSCANQTIFELPVK